MEGGVDDPSYTLNPKHYTLNTTPCTLQPQHDNLHHVPCSLYHAPCTLHPTPCALHPTPRTPNTTPLTPQRPPPPQIGPLRTEPLTVFRMSVRDPGSLSRASGAHLVADHFRSGWSLTTKKKTRSTLRTVPSPLNLRTKTRYPHPTPPRQTPDAGRQTPDARR